MHVYTKTRHTSVKIMIKEERVHFKKFEKIDTATKIMRLKGGER